MPTITAFQLMALNGMTSCLWRRPDWRMPLFRHACSKSSALFSAPRYHSTTFFKALTKCCEGLVTILWTNHFVHSSLRGTAPCARKVSQRQPRLCLGGSPTSFEPSATNLPNTRDTLPKTCFVPPDKVRRGLELTLADDRFDSLAVGHFELSSV